MTNTSTFAGLSRGSSAIGALSRPSLLLSALAIVLFLTFPQNQLKAQFFDFNMDSTFGVAPIGPGFEPDPLVIVIDAGGMIDAAYLGGECVGFAAAAPDYRVNWSSRGTTALRFIFEAHNPNDDTTLIINAPDGSWYCNDDAFSGTFNPMVIFDNPAAGQYDIWVGTYSAGPTVTGRLYITEYAAVPGEMQALANQSGNDASLDVSGDAIFEDITLRAGFTPDPAQFRGIAGGTVDVAANFSSGSDCVGFASQNPDFRLFWTGDTSDLRVFFEADNDGDDTVLIINTSNGAWICNDDAHFNTLNPSLDLRGYPAGRFDIWIGTFREGQYLNGTLNITELDIQVK
ncbi:MAG: hypothetical protein LAT75_06825 [Candidatus Cyclonatronum sp.]|uniref:hypothetical protein n=1 Tax=Cyclonatronum sp. TaxID=3024185 RepID=UPI0025C2BD8E|nr:hypothetical protein [Cyclonatronum sp.]MCH8486561.1 hypothetical protein [Cyclonatronum sp.]